MERTESIARNVLPEGAPIGEGITELINLFTEMKIPDETIAGMICCLKGQTPEEMDKTARSLIKHFKKPVNREN